MNEPPVLRASEATDNSTARMGGSESTWFDYSEGFRQAADRLVEVFQSGEMPARFHEPFRGLDLPNLGYLLPAFVGYPVLFLYRHALELGIKGVLQEATPRLRRRVRIQVSHDLETLFRDVSLVVLEAWPEFDKTTLDGLEALVSEFQAEDPTGEAFRYPLSTSGQPTLPAPRLVNLRRVRDVVGEAARILRGIADGMEEEARNVGGDTN